MARRQASPKAFREVQSPFVGGDVDALQLYAAYGQACAFTGDDLSREAAADPHGYLLALGPGPPGDPTRLVPASLEAIHAYERGHLALGPRYNFLVDLERIDPELVERLNPIGRLRLPTNEAFHPSLDLIAAHRSAVADGDFSRD